MKNLLKKFVKDEQGLELSEYAIMIALILAVAALVISSVGTEITSIFTDLVTYLQGGTPA